MSYHTQEQEEELAVTDREPARLGDSYLFYCAWTSRLL